MVSVGVNVPSPPYSAMNSSVRAVVRLCTATGIPCRAILRARLAPMTANPVTPIRLSAAMCCSLLRRAWPAGAKPVRALGEFLPAPIVRRLCAMRQRVRHLVPRPERRAPPRRPSTGHAVPRGLMTQADRWAGIRGSGSRPGEAARWVAVDDVVGADAFHLATEDQMPEAGGIAVADVRMRQEIRIRSDSGIRLPPIAARSMTSRQTPDPKRPFRAFRRAPEDQLPSLSPGGGSDRRAAGLTPE